MIAIFLVQSYRRWVNRRTETVSFVNDITLRRRTTVDATLPEPPDEVSLPSDRIVYVPLTILKKSPLSNLDLRDESGTSLPVLNTEQNARIAEEGLTLLLLGLVQTTSPGTDDLTVAEELAPLIRKVVREDSADALTAVHAIQAHEALRALFVPESGTQSDEVQVASQVMAELARGFLFLTPVEYRAGAHHLYKLSYEDEIRWRGEGSFRRRFGGVFNALFVSLGLASKSIRLDELQVGWAQSYHMELVAPEDIGIVRLRLDRHTTNADGGIDVKREPESRNRSRAHVNTSSTDRADLGVAIARLQPRRTGVYGALVMVSAVLGSLMGALMWAGDQRLEHLDKQTGATVLLALPAVLVAYLVRPEEHGFATRALLGVRVMALVSSASALALSAMVAARLFLTPVDPTFLEVVHWLEWATIGIAALLLAGFVRPEMLWLLRAIGAALGLIWRGLRCVGGWTARRLRRILRKDGRPAETSPTIRSE